MRAALGVTLTLYLVLKACRFEDLTVVPSNLLAFPVTLKAPGNGFVAYAPIYNDLDAARRDWPDAEIVPLDAPDDHPKAAALRGNGG